MTKVVDATPQHLPTPLRTKTEKNQDRHRKNKNRKPTEYLPLKEAIKKAHIP